MSFHINRKGKVSKCNAKKGNCPFGGEHEHFSTIKQANDYMYKESENEYGIIPELDNSYEYWQKESLKYSNFDEFVKDNARNIVEDKVFETRENIYENTLKLWKDAHYENSLLNTHQISINNAIDIIRDKVDKQSLHGWFREYNSEYKTKIENIIITDSEVRNASLNIAYINYKILTGSEIEFNDFINSEIEVYRGGNFKFIKEDVFISYSFDKNVAEKFAEGNENTRIESKKVKIKDTLGSLQTTNEMEILTRREIK